MVVLETENTRLKDFAETSEAEKKKLEVELVQVSEQNHQLQDQLQEQMAKYQELEKRNAELPVRLQEEREKIQVIYEQEKEMLHRELQEVKAASDAVAERAQVVTREREVLKQELAEAKAVSSATEDRVRALEVERETLQKQLEEAKARPEVDSTASREVSENDPFERSGAMLSVQLEHAMKRNEELQKIIDQSLSNDAAPGLKSQASVTEGPTAFGKLIDGWLGVLEEAQLESSLDRLKQSDAKPTAQSGWFSSLFGQT